MAMKEGWKQRSSVYKYRHKCPRCGRVFYCNGYHRHVSYTLSGDRILEKRHKCTLTRILDKIGSCECPQHNLGFECEVVYEDRMETETGEL